MPSPGIRTTGVVKGISSACPPPNVLARGSVVKASFSALSSVSMYSTADFYANSNQQLDPAPLIRLQRPHTEVTLALARVSQEYNIGASSSGLSVPGRRDTE